MKGILFNTKMVQAILDDRKSCTRRPIKPQPTRPYYCGIGHRWDDGHGYEIKPICLVGDILYVRETFCYEKDFNPDGVRNIHFNYPKFYYKADIIPGLKDIAKWSPSIHMPREVARIFLEVTDVGVERLQDITREGAIQEGVTIPHSNGINKGKERTGFQSLWNSTIKKQNFDKYSWQANPYVWVYEFKRVDKPEVTKCIPK